MTVYLVGAGPGDPGLITARGLELLRSCDLVVHDRLVSDELVAAAPGDAVRIGRDQLSQAEIDELLVAAGRQSLRVVRLKGGDPFVFGRGGEEAIALAAAGVPFEIVPGVSSLAAVPAAAGIPITHRGVAAQVTILSGHDTATLDYPALARTPGTLVLFMALGNLPAIADGLLDQGKDPATPAAVVSAGSLPEQQTAIAPLGQIADVAVRLDPPALVVIGEVVALAEALTLASGEAKELTGATAEAAR